MQRLFDKHWDNMASVKNMIKINLMKSDKENSLPLLIETA